MQIYSEQRIRRLLAITNGISLGLIVVRVAVYPAYFRMPGAAMILAQAVVPIILYCTLLLWRRRESSIPHAAQVRFAVLGLAAGLLQAIHVVFERFVELPGKWSSFVVLGFMLATFSIWASAGYQSALAGFPILVSIRQSVWTAVVTMTIAVAAGTALELYLAPIPPESMRHWAEFERSGWSDIQAFAISNTLDSVATHLMLGPIVAAVLGALSSLLVIVKRRLA